MAAGILTCVLVCSLAVCSVAAYPNEYLPQKFQALEEKLDALTMDNQQKFEELNEHNQKLQKENHKMEEKFDVLKSHNHDLKIENQELLALKEKVDHLQEENQIQGKQIMDLQMRSFSLENTIITDAENRQLTENTIFLAVLSRYTVPVYPGNPIIWDSAPLNPGGYFNTILGMYTVPMNGYYQFSVTKMGDNLYGSFYFLVDEIRVAYKEFLFYDSDSTLAGSATLNIELRTGQVVRIENVGSTAVYGTDSKGIYWSWFTGHMLYGI